MIDDVPDGADIIVTGAMSEKLTKTRGYTLKTTQTEINEKPNIIGYTFTNERYIGSIEITKALAGTRSDKGAAARRSPSDVKLWNEHNLNLLNAQTSTMPSGVDGLTKTNEQRDGHDVYAGTVSITMGEDGQPVSASITNIRRIRAAMRLSNATVRTTATTQTPQNAFWHHRRGERSGPRRGHDVHEYARERHACAEQGAQRATRRTGKRSSRSA